jgi:hypothetical protein
MTVDKFFEKHRPYQLTPMSVIELMEKWLEYYRVGTIFSTLTANKENQDDFGIETFEQFNAWFENRIKP